MTKQAEIKRSVIRWFEVAEIPVVKPSGEVENLRYRQIYGKILVQVSKAHELGISVSKIRRYQREGKLTPFNANGTPKRSKKSTDVFFDLRQFQDINFD